MLVFHAGLLSICRYYVDEESTMDAPKVSVIIPAYNGANYIEDTIQSVLGQTYSNFEIITVDDASTDKTADAVKQFNDPRIKYIVHEKNQGSDVARETGLRASRGEIVAFLDQDDYYHPEKLQAHVAFLEHNPDIGFSYNARFELNYSAKTIRNIWRPSQNITLADLVLWFPIAPSDWVFRRAWTSRLTELINAYKMIWTGNEIVYLGKLFMDGCKFGMVNRALNYRRYHSKRIYKDIGCGCQMEVSSQDRIFEDPRCPPNVAALHDFAHANIYMYWAFRAFVQNETPTAQELLRKAIYHKSGIVEGKPAEFVDFLVTNCIDDENVDHEVLLRSVFAQFPSEIEHLSKQLGWAIGQGFLRKGVREAMWADIRSGQPFFVKARDLGIEIEDAFLSHFVHGLLDYELEYGERAVNELHTNILRGLKDIWKSKDLGRLNRLFALNRSFQCYSNREYRKVLSQVLQTCMINPKDFTNCGLLSIFVRSAVKSISAK